MTRPLPIVSLFVLSVALAGCEEATEAARVELPVVVDAAGLETVTTDLGYEVEVDSARIALQDLAFTVAGEVHTSSTRRRVRDLFVSTAVAHPGHYQGGEVTGALPGAYVVDWPVDDGRELGVATLIAGAYDAANFTFGRASADALEEGDPLLGHTARFSGVATRGDDAIAFTIVVDSPEGRELVGVPFEATLRPESTGALHLRFETADPLEGDTLFDGIDFAALDADADGELSIGPEEAGAEDAYNVFRRTFQTHDHYGIHYRP